MFHVQGAAKHSCCMLAVLCSTNSNNEDDDNVQQTPLRFPFPDITSSGRLEVYLFIIHMLHVFAFFCFFKSTFFFFLY